MISKQQQLNIIGREFQAWYNYERPHSAVHDLPPGSQSLPELPPNASTRDVVCSTRLGGLLKHRWRRAA